MTEVSSNRYSTTLSAAVNNSTTSIPLTSVVGAPTGGTWRLLVDNEFMLVNLVVGNTAVVTRGIEGTTAVSHASGATATHVITSGGLAAMIAQKPAVLPVTSENHGKAEIVDYVTFSGTTDIPTTPFFDCNTLGLYRISWVILDPLAGGSGAVTLTISWTDDAGATTVTPSETMGTPSRGQGSNICQLASPGITYSTHQTGPANQYNLYIVVERLNIRAPELVWDADNNLVLTEVTP